jgi:acyl carrier protein
MGLFRSRKSRGVHFGAAAAQWAESRFSPELQPVGAFVADLLCEQLGVGFAQLEPQTRFTEDLDMTELEPVEVVMALEEELGIKIPDDDAPRLSTISDLVRYLYDRLQKNEQRD